MTTRVKHLLNEASSLTEAKRADLAAWLLESLDPASEERVEEAWAQEIERRVADLREGTVQTVPWERVRQEALRALNAARSR